MVGVGEVERLGGVFIFKDARLEHTGGADADEDAEEGSMDRQEGELGDAGRQDREQGGQQAEDDAGRRHVGLDGGIGVVEDAAQVVPAVLEDGELVDASEVDPCCSFQAGVFVLVDGEGGIAGIAGRGSKVHTAFAKPMHVLPGSMCRLDEAQRQDEGRHKP